jgi:uncharacterized protein
VRSEQVVGRSHYWGSLTLKLADTSRPSGQWSDDPASRQPSLQQAGSGFYARQCSSTWIAARGSEAADRASPEWGKAGLGPYIGSASRALMPKEERFFDLFTHHARITLAAAKALRALLKGDDDVLRCRREITRCENEADEITREVMTALRKTFITPLDRGDKKDLITSMDDSIDQMNQTAKVITLFEMRSFQPHMRQMGDIIVQAAELTADAVPLLSSLSTQSGRLNSFAEEMIRLEEQADHLHDEGRKQLFLNQKDAITFVVGTEVYDHLEMVMDRFEDVANEISAIIIENV